VVVTAFDRTLIDRDFYILRKLAGTPYSQSTSLAHEDHNRIFFQLGQYLRELHHMVGSAYGYDGATQSVWLKAFKTMWSNLIQDVVACGLYDAQEAAELTFLLDQHQDSFNRDDLPALLYMSSQKENIMIDAEGNIIGLKGFDLSLWGDPEMDFAVLDCSGIWASSFWDGYGQVRPDDPASRIRRKFYILYEFQRNMPLAIWRMKDLVEADQTKQIALTIAKNLMVEEADQAP
jgi:fructosamine-3-kinase